jgi:hypothetical protein
MVATQFVDLLSYIILEYLVVRVQLRLLQEHLSLIRVATSHCKYSKCHSRFLYSILNFHDNINVNPAATGRQNMLRASVEKIELHKRWLIRSFKSIISSRNFRLQSSNISMLLYAKYNKLGNLSVQNRSLTKLLQCSGWCFETALFLREVDNQYQNTI